MGSVKLVTPSGSITLEGEDTAGASTVVIPKAGVVEAGTLKEIGVDQVWTQFAVGVTRSLNVTYTNNTGKPIMILVSAARIGTDLMTLVVDGNTIANTGSQSSSNNVMVLISAIIPNGSTYSCTSSHALSRWSELR